MQTKTRTSLARTGIAVWILAMGVPFLSGCNSSTSTPPPVTPEAAGNLQGAGGKKPQSAGGGGGGTPDLNVYPAPSGQQTGVLAGGKK